MCVIATVEAKVHSSSVSIVLRSTFAHSIFEGSPSKEGFHGTHETPSGSNLYTVLFQTLISLLY